ncbi:MAG: S1 RNA-binding domain-containing protein [Thermodesulfovibrionales bacterium]|nr:S1 RNA-binding domain-containing protein [Thermodesulfovibrionales bacterium]
MVVNDETQEFSRLLEESLRSQTYFDRGQKVTVSVIRVTPEYVFVDIGGKREGVIKTSEFYDENNELAVSIGEKVEAFFEGTHDGLMRFTTLINGQPIRLINYIEDCFENTIPVEGTVVKEIKGGFEVRVKNIRCFCPQSQIGFKNENQDHIGKTYDFRIIDYKKDTLGIVLSRKVLLEEAKRKRISELKERINIGDEIDAPITSIKPFGLFVDIGAMEGFIPISELSWGRVDNIDDLFNIGQTIRAKIISADIENEKVVLSCKAIQPDPWLNIQERYPVGSRVTAKITKIMPYGVFASIEEGVEGLIHISNLATGRHIKHPSEVVKEGDIVDAYVISLDVENKKISLTLRSPQKKEISYPNEGEIIEVTVKKVMPFGILSKIDDDLVGLIPMSETGLSKGDDVKTVFAEGKVLKVVIQEVDKERSRVTLSRKDYLDIKDKEEFRQYIKEQRDKEKSGLGSLGEIIEKTIKKAV